MGVSQTAGTACCRAWGLQGTRCVGETEETPEGWHTDREGGAGKVGGNWSLRDFVLGHLVKESAFKKKTENCQRLQAEETPPHVCILKRGLWMHHGHSVGGGPERILRGSLSERGQKTLRKGVLGCTGQNLGSERGKLPMLIPAVPAQTSQGHFSNEMNSCVTSVWHTVGTQ